MTRSSLKICFVTNEYPPRPIWGGAGIYAKRLTEELARLGHKVYVLSWGFPCDKRIENLAVHRIETSGLPYLGEICYGVKLPAALIKLHNMTGGFDILHLNGPEISAMLSLVASKISRTLGSVSKLVTVHHLMHDCASLANSIHFGTIRRFLAEGGWFPRVVEAAVLKRVDGIIAVSEYTRRALSKAYGIPPERVYAIHHGVSYSFEEDGAERRAEDSSNSILLLNVGRAEPRKGISVLLGAFESLSSRHKDLRLVLVGRGTGKACDEYHPPPHTRKRIRTYEWLGEKDLKVMYKACDIYVSPSYLEGFGLAVLEAMAAGKPIVASRAGATQEIIKQHVNGVLVKPRDSNALSDAIENLIEDRHLMSRIGSFNRKYVMSHFSWQEAAARTVEVYCKTMDRSD